MHVSQVLERQQHSLTCSQCLPAAACTWWRRGAGALRTVSSNHAASGCYSGFPLSLLRHMTTMDTLAALVWSRCATGAGAGSHVEAPARLVAQHQNAAKKRTVLALLGHNSLPHSVASDAKLLETSSGLGTGGRRGVRHLAPAARGGRK